MIRPEDRMRRLLMLLHALWDVRGELSDRRVSEIDRENLDRFQRERLDAIMEQHLRARRAYDELNLTDAYEGTTASVSCTPEERRGVELLALGVLEGKLSPEHAYDRLVSDRFPENVLKGGDLGGERMGTPE